MDIEVEKVMDREQIAKAIRDFLDSGVEILGKAKLEQSDYGKIKVLRTMGSIINAGVIMVQQETAQQRLTVINERMKQLGYAPVEPKKLT